MEYPWDIPGIWMGYPWNIYAWAMPLVGLIVAGKGAEEHPVNVLAMRKQPLWGMVTRLGRRGHQETAGGPFGH
jgi:hypothetical protein